MPRFLSMVRIDEQNAARRGPQPRADAAHGRAAGGDHQGRASCSTPPGSTPTSEGTRVTWSGGKLSYTDGPFTESKEVIGGYAIIQARTRPRRWSGRSGSWRSTRSTGPSPAEVREIDEG